MKNKRINELLEAYEDEVKEAVLKGLEKEEEKINLLNPKGIKKDLREVIEEVINN